MDLSNYDQDIILARENATPQVKEIFDRSEEVFNLLLHLKKIDNPLLNLPIKTLGLTKQCVSILQEMEQFVSPTDDIYYLQAGKLYNIVNNIQVHWGKLFVASIVKKQGTPDNETVSGLLSLLKDSMKEITKLNLTSDLKEEITSSLKKMGESPLPKRENYSSSTRGNESSGCLSVVLFFIVTITLFSLF